MIEIINLTKKFKEDVIFEDFNLKIEEGNITYLTGSNGSGKTVMIKVLTNLYNKTSGTIKYDDKEDVELFIKDNLRVGFNENYFLGDYTGKDNLNKLFKLNNISNDKVDYWFKRLELKDTLVKNYSSGMLKKLTLIQAIYEEKKYIVLDEPFANVDKETTLKMVEIIKELKEKGIGILITTHTDDLVSGLDDLRVEMK